MEIKFETKEIEQMVLEYAKKKYKKDFKLKSWVEANEPNGILVECKEDEKLEF